jgi:hypothetical protein
VAGKGAAGRCPETATRRDTQIPDYRCSGILTDANQWVNTSWWYVDDAPQVMELEWREATDPSSADGRLVMWINEVQSETREGIANFSLSVDLVRLGLVAGVDTGTLGSMNFDAFESRGTGIGCRAKSDADADAVGNADPT